MTMTGMIDSLIDSLYKCEPSCGAVAIHLENSNSIGMMRVSYGYLCLLCIFQFVVVCNHYYLMNPTGAIDSSNALSMTIE